MYNIYEYIGVSIRYMSIRLVAYTRYINYI